MFIKYIIILNIIVLSELLLDSQDSMLQMITQEKLDDSFSIWFKFLPAQIGYDIVSFQQVSDQIIYPFIAYNELDNLMFCLSADDCTSISNMQKYQTAYQWIHIIISENIRMDQPKRLIVFNETLNQEYLLVLKKSQHYRCLIYDRVQQVEKRIQNFNYEKLVRPPELLELFTQQSSIQIFLRQYQENQCDDNQELLRLEHKNLLKIQLIDSNNVQFKINDDFIDDAPIQELNKWFQIYFIINYQIIKFLLIVQDYTYTKEYQIQLGKEIPLYYNLLIYMQANNYNFQSSIYYQFYNENEIFNACHSYCKQCNVTCLSCYVDDCYCQENQFFNTTDKTCQHYSQLPNIEIIQLTKPCQRGYIINNTTNKCEINEIQYEGEMNYQSKFDEDSVEIQFQIVEDLIFRNSFLDFSESNKTSSLLFDYPSDYSSKIFEMLNDLHLVIIKVKELFIIYKYTDGFQLCRHQYFGSRCQFKLQNCLRSNNQKCLFCQPNYILIQFQCYKCPLNCLICEYTQGRLNCLFSSEGYYINYQNLLKKCFNCETCSRTGCISKQEVVDQMYVCDQNKFCFRDIVLTCHNREQFLLDLRQQQCQQFSQVLIQLIQSLLFTNEKYLGDYQIPFVQQMIVNSINTNNTNIFFNEQVSQIYRFEQLKYLFFLILGQKLSNQEQHFLQQNGYACIQKYIYNNSINCIKYDYDPRIYDLSKKCYGNYTCKYNLTLNNVQIYMGRVTSIFYENQQYDSLEDLLLSIYDIGFDFQFITINASLIMSSFNNDEEYNSGSLLQINKQQLPYNLENCQFILYLYYQTYGEDISMSDIHTSIKADQIFLFNFIVHFTIQLNIDCQEFLLNNTQIHNSTFLLYISSRIQINILNTLIGNIDVKNFLQFTIQGYTEFLFISNFIIVNSYLIQSLFNLASIQSIRLHQIGFYESKLINCIIFRINFVQILQVMDLSSDSIELQSGLYIQIGLASELMISKINFNNVYVSSLNPLFMNKQSFGVSIDDVTIYNSNLQIPCVFLINASDKLMMENVYLYLNAIIIIKFQGGTLVLKELTIYQQEAQPIQIIQSLSNKVLINQIEYKSNYLTLIQDSAYYLIHIISLKESLINNIRFSNLFFDNYAILYVESKSFIQFHNISIDNCKFVVQQQLLNLISVNILGISIFQNIHISNVEIKNKKINNQLSLFNLNGTNDVCYMKNVLIQNVRVYSTFEYNIFSFTNNKLQIVEIDILNNQNVKFFYLQSQDTQISSLQILNNSNFKVMFVVGYKNNYLISFIQIKDLYVHGLTGTLISNIDYLGRYNIYLDNIKIKLVNFHTVINLVMKNTILKINNLSIQESGQFQSCLETQIFQITFTKLSLYNLTITDLRLRFGYILHPQQIEIKQMLIKNVILDNFENKLSQSFMTLLINQTMMFSDITIINSTFSELSYIFAYIFQGTLILENFKILDVDSNYDLMEFKLFNQSNSVQLSNFVVQNLKTDGLLFTESEVQSSSIFIDDCYIHNFYKTIFFSNEKTSIRINNSLFINSHIIFNHEQKISLIVQDSQIINHQQYSFQQIKIQKSLIFDEITSSFALTRTFGIYLSFNFGESFPSTRRLTQYVNQIVFDNRNTSSFFYIPSGQIINKYERLELQQLDYYQIYKGFSIVVQGLHQQKMICNITSTYKGEEVEVFNYKQLVLQQGLNQIENLISVINPFNSDYVQNDIQCENYTLRFNTKAFRCQLGEYIFQNQCLQCDVQKGLYSTLYNSTHCYNVNYNQIEQLKVGLIKLRKGYWRYNFSTIFIEYCNNKFNCNGGWTTGDNSCNSSRIGALCQECDIYNRMGNGHYTKNINNCQVCDVNYTLIYQILFSIIWQMLLTFINIYSKDSLSKQFLFYKVGFSNFYQVLYRLSIDQPSVMLKMFLNYIFQIYLIRENFDSLGQLLVLNINYMNNPNLIMQAQLDCLFIYVQNIDIIYTQFFFTLCNLFFILNLQYFIYLVIVKLKIATFSIKIIFLITAETLIFNLKIILEVSFKLITNQDISRIKWVTSNLSFEYYAPNHIGWLKNYIIPIASTLTLTPIMIINLLKLNANIYRKVKKTFSLFQQAYKNNYFFWEYVLIYTKLLFILISIINREQLQLTTFLSIGLHFTIYHQQPYYLKNLNHIDIRLLLFLIIIAQFLLLANNGFVISLIFLMNIYVTYDIAKLVIKKSVQLNRQTVFDYKLLITNKFPKLRKISGLEKDQQTISNQRLMRQVIRKKYLSRKNSQVTTKSFISKPETVSLQNEIELATFKSASSI